MDTGRCLFYAVWLFKWEHRLGEEDDEDEKDDTDEVEEQSEYQPEMKAAKVSDEL